MRLKNDLVDAAEKIRDTVFRIYETDEPIHKQQLRTLYENARDLNIALQKRKTQGKVIG